MAEEDLRTYSPNMGSYKRRRPETVTAIQWTGKNLEEIKGFVNGLDILRFVRSSGVLVIRTGEGDKEVKFGDYIVEDDDHPTVYVMSQIAFENKFIGE